MKSLALKTAMSAIALVVAIWPIANVAADEDVIVIGTSLYAQACYDAAHDYAADVIAGHVDVGASITKRVPGPTGTNLALDGLEACTVALEEEGLSEHDLAGTYNNRGALYFARGSYKEALADFDKGISHDSHFAALHANRGATLMALQRWSDGVNALDAALKIIESDPTQTDYNPAKARFNRGMAMEKMGDIRAAYYDYLKAAELLPEWDLPRAELARFTVRKKAP